MRVRVRVRVRVRMRASVAHVSCVLVPSASQVASQGSESKLTWLRLGLGLGIGLGLGLGIELGLGLGLGLGVRGEAHRRGVFLARVEVPERIVHRIHLAVPHLALCEVCRALCGDPVLALLLRLVAFAGVRGGKVAAPRPPG